MSAIYDTDAIDSLLAEIDVSSLDATQKEKLRDFVVERAIKKAREDFYTYVKLMAPCMLPEDYQDGRHIEIIANEMQKVEQAVGHPKKVGKLQVFLPPGSMKSVLSQLFVTWCFGRHPKWRILGIGHSRDFAIDNFGRPIRDLIDTEEYREIFPDVSLHHDVKGAGRWHTNAGGIYYAAGANSKIAGRRAHIAICDDVISEQDAESEVKRPAINRWYGKGLQSRLLPNACEIIINTRWHLEDLSGYTLNADKNSKRPWKVVRVPALVDAEARELLWREGDPVEKYDIGTSFWPEFWSTEELLAKKASPTISPQDWNALYQQSPVPDEGNIIKMEDFQNWVYDEAPLCDYIVISLDTALSTTTRSDYSAYTVWGIYQTNEVLFDGTEQACAKMILLDASKGRWDFPTLVSKVCELYDNFDPDLFIVEKKSSGISLIQEMRKRMLPVHEYLPDRDKEARAHAATALMRAGRVVVPMNRSYAPDVVSECIQFPFGPHDDYTDTVTQCVLWMRDSWKIYHPKDRFEEEDDEYYRPYRERKTYWQRATPLH